MAPVFDFSQNIPAFRVRDIEENDNIPIDEETRQIILNSINNIEDDNITYYNGSGDEMDINHSDSFNQVDVDNLKIEENINPLNENDNYNIIEVDTLCKGITENMKHNLIDKEIIDNDELNNKYSEIVSEKLKYIYVAHRLGYDDLTRNTIMNLFGKILTDFEMDYNYFSLKESNNIYVLYNNKKDDKNLDILKNSKKYIPQVDDDDLYLIKFKHKKINYKLLQFLDKTKKIKNNKAPNIDSNFYKNIKDKTIVLKNNNKILLSKYKDINSELDLIQKEIEDIEKVLPIYNKLKDNKNIIDLDITMLNDFQLLFKKYENDKINEYSTIKEIGKKIINEKYDDNHIKEMVKYYNPDRLKRFIKKCKRIYVLSKHVNITIIATASISHFIRDSREDIFNILIDLLKSNPLNS